MKVPLLPRLAPAQSSSIPAVHHFAADNPVTRLTSVVGNTPLIEIHFRLRGSLRRVYAKYESLNLTGSIKDRMLYTFSEAPMRIT